MKESGREGCLGAGLLVPIIKAKNVRKGWLAGWP